MQANVQEFSSGKIGKREIRRLVEKELNLAANVLEIKKKLIGKVAKQTNATHS